MINIRRSRRRSAACGLVLWLAQCCATAGTATLLAESDTLMLAEFEDGSGTTPQHALREALRAALDESPYLNLAPDAVVEGVRHGRSAAMAADDLRQLCQSVHARAYVRGTLARASEGAALQGQLQALECSNGTPLAHEEFTADRVRLLDALGAAARRLRRDLGEPPSSVEHFSTPVSQATSGSFEALGAWSSGLAEWREHGAAAAIPRLQKAIAEDPGFAAATYDLGLAYRDSGQEERARELFTRAFALRAHASRRRVLNITAQYHAFVTVDEQRAVQAFREWSTSYPRDYKAVSNLGSFYGDVCRYPEAIAQFELARRMNPADIVSHEDLMEMLIAVGEFKKARVVYQDILRLHLDDDSPHLYLYVIAALENNSAEMAAQSAWFEDKKELQHEILSEQADAAALSGNLEQARELSERAVASARTAGNLEQAASWLLNSAWREELLGKEQLAREQALQALSIAHGSREGEATAAIILARTGDIARAESLMADIEKRYPNHSVVQSYWLPSIRAQLALGRGDTATALKELTSAAPLDLLYPQVFFYSHMPSVVLRAEAYQLRGERTRAAEQWQTILRNPGITQLSATARYAQRQLGQSEGLKGATG